MAKLAQKRITDETAYLPLGVDFMPFDNHALTLRNYSCKQSTATPPAIPALPANVDWRVSRLYQFVDQHCGRVGYNLEEVCEQLDLGVTASHASRLFRQQLGLGIREYQKLKRLHTAAAKLQGTSLSVKEIAGELGYRTPTDFFRQFKLYFHVTPRKFRALQHACARHRQADA